MAVRYESRERPCTSCGAMVSVQVVTSEAPRSVGPQRRAIHDDDGTPADTNCARERSHGADASDWGDVGGAD